MHALEVPCPLCEQPVGWPCREDECVLQAYPHKHRVRLASHTTISNENIWAELLAANLSMAGLLSVRWTSQGRLA